MTRRSKLWLVIASLFTLVNIGGAPFAAWDGEEMHAAVHVGLAVLGVFFVWRIASRARREDLPGMQRSDDRLERLQQSVDAIALEVERIGEAQRFSAKLAAERVEASPAKPPPVMRRPNDEL